MRLKKYEFKEKGKKEKKWSEFFFFSSSNHDQEIERKVIVEYPEIY